MREFEDEVHRQPSYYGITQEQRNSYHKRKTFGSSIIENKKGYQIEISSVSPKSGLRPGSRGLQKWGSEVSSHSSQMYKLLDNTLTKNDPRFS